MTDRERVGPLRTVWRFYLRQKAAWRAARVARCRAVSDETIERTPPMPVDPRADIEIQCLSCERDHLDLLWCVKTFGHYAGRPFSLLVHDDGSLSPQAIGRLREHLPGLRIVSRPEADERVADALADRPHARTFRDRLPLARRTIDFPLFARRPRYLILDSDVLFFARPTEMLDGLDRGRPFFMSDYQDGYVHPREEIASRYGVEIVPAFNTGICCFSVDMADLDFVERYSADAERDDLLAHPWTEQTLFALLFSRRKEGVDRLPPTYRISRQPIDAGSVSHHFVNDGSRGAFYTEGVPYLRNAGFLRDLAGTPSPPATSPAAAPPPSEDPR